MTPVMRARRPCSLTEAAAKVVVRGKGAQPAPSTRARCACMCVLEGPMAHPRALAYSGMAARGTRPCGIHLGLSLARRLGTSSTWSAPPARPGRAWSRDAGTSCGSRPAPLLAVLPAPPARVATRPTRVDGRSEPPDAAPLLGPEQWTRSMRAGRCAQTRASSPLARTQRSPSSLGASIWKPAKAFSFSATLHATLRARWPAFAPRRGSAIAIIEQERATGAATLLRCWHAPLILLPGSECTRIAASGCWE